MDSVTDYVDYRWPAAFLMAALVAKRVTRTRFWANPLLRSVGGLLVLAVCVCVFVTPPMIVWVNDVTGVPNLAAPWVYTLLTLFSFSCLLMIIAWQRGMDRARRVLGWTTVVYAAVVVALWVLFALADTPVERVRDFDTFYATTPYARELIVLYLLAHAAAGTVTSALVWSWLFSGKHEVRGWLLAGLVMLGGCYALNIVFDVLKLTAVVARWNGHDLDWLSTRAAPLAGAFSAVLAGLGFLTPHLGEDLQGRRAARAAYRRLEPLHRLLQEAGVLLRSPATGRADAYLALTRRDTAVRDSVLNLAPYLDAALWDRARAEAARCGASAGEEGDGLAGAVVLTAALGARGASSPPETALDVTAILGRLPAIADALRRPDALETVRRRCAASTGSTHVHDR